MTNYVVTCVCKTCHQIFYVDIQDIEKVRHCAFCKSPQVNVGDITDKYSLKYDGIDNWD